MRTRTVLATLPVALLLALTGCGAGGDDAGDGNADGVASADGTEPDDDGGNGSEDDGADLSDDEHHDLLLDYAQCLRDNGLDVDDPAPGEGISLQIEGDPSQADPALEACEHLAPPPPPDAEGDLADEDSREDMLGFAQCMRDNGVEAFEDPRSGEGIHIGPEVAEDPDFESAERTCNEEFFGGQPDTQQQDA